jgi:hypothetical protein
VRSLLTLGCSQRLPSIQTQRLALWVVHWLVQKYSQVIHLLLLLVVFLDF